MDLKKILSTMAILGLFVFSIISFIVITQEDSGIANKITNNSIINSSYSDLEEALGSEDIETASDNFGQVTPDQEFGELEVNSIVSPTKTIKSMTIGIWNVFIKLPQAVLGVSSIVASLVGGILLVFLIIGIWAVWKGVVT